MHYNINKYIYIYTYMYIYIYMYKWILWSHCGVIAPTNRHVSRRRDAVIVGSAVYNIFISIVKQTHIDIH